jgi:hypothetical protein
MTEEREFGDFVAEGRILVEQNEANQWALGDLACAFEISVGRPSKDDEDTPTLGDLANGWGLATSTVSEYRTLAAFYPKNLRLYELSWSHYKLARKASNGDVEEALALLEEAERQAFTIAAFRRFLEGIYYEGELYQEEVPDRLRAFVPGQARLWVTVKRREE